MDEIFEYPVKNQFSFGVVDYVSFAILLSVSAGIGVYFGFVKKQETTSEYLFGSNKLGIIPVAISLVASQMSAVAIMATPAEIYAFGSHYALVLPAQFFGVAIIIYIFTPIFYNNDISNCYEYLERRFNKQTRQLVTVSFLLTVYLTIPVFIFIPSLAFSQVTSINIHLINSIVCGVCVFYTMLGGIKAVVWTDVVQGGIMLGSCILIASMGIYEVGGLGEVLSRAYHGGRLHLNMNLNLEDRTSFWNSFFGALVIWTGYVGLNQSCVQRIVALPSLAHARKSLVIFCLGFFIIMSLNCLTGIIMYARYYTCDPVMLGMIEKPDKLMPFFVQDIVGHLRGMPGIFISCVFSAALSTISANLNSLSGIVYFDYIKPFINHTEHKANLIMKLLVVLTGIYCVIGGLIVEQCTSILQVVVTICGITQGAVVGVFLLGMLYPKANGKSALTATLTSMVIMAWIIIGSQVLIGRGELVYEPLPGRVDNCSQFNITAEYVDLTDGSDQIEESFSLYKMSFNWFTIFGALIVWIVGVPLSHILKDDKKLNINLISPLGMWLVPKDLRHMAVPQEEELKPIELQNMS